VVALPAAAPALAPACVAKADANCAWLAESPVASPEPPGPRKIAMIYLLTI
jgi:hypothetical protein